MGSIRVLTETDLRSVVGLAPEELSVVESVYPLISDGRAAMPPIMRVDVPEHNGEIDIKSAYLPGHPGIAVKVSAGFFDNPSRNLPSLGGLVMLFDTETGVPAAALFDNGYLTDLRTALAGAVAARHLSVDGASVAGVLGAGVQAELQLAAIALVRPIERGLVWARHSERAIDCARRISDRIGIRVDAVDEVAAASGADILVTATPTREPLVTVEMLHPGLHVTAVGSDAEHKQELTADAVMAADLFACDSRPQSRRLGELRSVTDAGLERTAVELGEIISGLVGGRSDDADVTICDLTGTGAQDTAIAGLAVNRCIDAGLGVEIET